MSSKPKLFVQATLTGGVDTLITVPSGYVYSLGYIVVANKSSIHSETIDVLCGTAGDEITWAEESIPAGKRFEFTGPPLNLEAAQVLKMQSGTASALLDVLVSGFQTEVS